MRPGTSSGSSQNLHSSPQRTGSAGDRVHSERQSSGAASGPMSTHYTSSSHSGRPASHGGSPLVSFAPEAFETLMAGRAASATTPTTKTAATAASSSISSPPTQLSQRSQPGARTQVAQHTQREHTQDLSRVPRRSSPTPNSSSSPSGPLPSVSMGSGYYSERGASRSSHYPSTSATSGAATGGSSSTTLGPSHDSSGSTQNYEQWASPAEVVQFQQLVLQLKDKHKRDVLHLQQLLIDEQEARLAQHQQAKEASEALTAQLRQAEKEQLKHVEQLQREQKQHAYDRHIAQLQLQAYDLEKGALVKRLEELEAQQSIRAALASYDGLLRAVLGGQRAVGSGAPAHSDHTTTDPHRPSSDLHEIGDQHNHTLNPASSGQSRPPLPAVQGAAQSMSSSSSHATPSSWFTESSRESREPLPATEGVARAELSSLPPHLPAEFINEFVCHIVHNELASMETVDRLEQLLIQRNEAFELAQCFWTRTQNSLEQKHQCLLQEMLSLKSRKEEAEQNWRKAYEEREAECARLAQEVAHVKAENEAVRHALEDGEARWEAAMSSAAQKHAAAIEALQQEAAKAAKSHQQALEALMDDQEASRCNFARALEQKAAQRARVEASLVEQLATAEAAFHGMRAESKQILEQVRERDAQALARETLLRRDVEHFSRRALDLEAQLEELTARAATQGVPEGAAGDCCIPAGHLPTPAAVDALRAELFQAQEQLQHMARVVEQHRLLQLQLDNEKLERRDHEAYHEHQLRVAHEALKQLQLQHEAERHRAHRTEKKLEKTIRQLCMQLLAVKGLVQLDPPGGAAKLCKPRRERSSALGDASTAGAMEQPLVHGAGPPPPPVWAPKSRPPSPTAGVLDAVKAVKKCEVLSRELRNSVHRE